MARRADLLDLAEPHARQERREARRGRDLGVGHDDVVPGVRGPGGDRREPARHRARRRRRRRPRDRAARTPGRRRECASCRPRTRANDPSSSTRWWGRPPARARWSPHASDWWTSPPGTSTTRASQAASSCCGRLAEHAQDWDVASGPGHARCHSDGPGAARRSRAPAQPRSRPGPADPRLLGSVVDAPADRVQHQVPAPDVPDLAAAEPGLEVGDARVREPPQVVGRGAFLAGAPDRLPLEEVVGAQVGPRDRHPAVRLDDAPSAAHEEEARERRAVRADGEEDAGPAGGPERRVDVPVRLLDPDEKAGPVGRLAVDRVEGPDRVARQLDDGHAVGARLVDVLAPLLAQVRPERLLVAGEVDDPAAGRLDGRRGRPPCAEQAGPQGPGGVVRARRPPPPGRSAGARRARGRPERPGAPRSAPASASGVHASATGPRGAYPNAHGRGRGRRRRSCIPIREPGAPATMRRAAQPLAALTRAQPSSWRYEPCSVPSTNASHAAGSAKSPRSPGPLTRHPGPGRTGRGRR